MKAAAIALLVLAGCQQPTGKPYADENAAISARAVSDVAQLKSKVQQLETENAQQRALIQSLHESIGLLNSSMTAVERNLSEQNRAYDAHLENVQAVRE
ncbi:MAG: hypothetical protein V4696_07600 [Pseudomonadota bacterium]